MGESPVQANLPARTRVTLHNRVLKLTMPSVTMVAGPIRLAQQPLRQPSSQLNTGVRHTSAHFAFLCAGAQRQFRQPETRRCARLANPQRDLLRQLVLRE